MDFKGGNRSGIPSGTPLQGLGNTSLTPSNLPVLTLCGEIYGVENPQACDTYKDINAHLPQENIHILENKIWGWTKGGSFELERERDKK